MGTRSIVAIKTGDNGSWKGRYVHWDGYPDGVGAAVVAVIERDGVEKAVKVLTEEHYGWSSLNATGGESTDSTRFTTVDGYGVAYVNDTEQPDEWITDADFGESWCEYVYVIDPQTGVVRAYEINGDKLQLLSENLATTLASEEV